MKKYKIYFLALMVSAGLVSCEENFTDPLVGDAVTGGLLTDVTALASYVVGNGNDYEYNASFTVYQGAVTTTNVDVYVSFQDNTNDLVSNEVLLTSIPVPASPQNQVFNFAVTYPELIEGLMIDGQPLPTSDTELNIGDAFVLRYVSTTSNGNLNSNASVTKIAVSTRFAGTYQVIQGEYWRINVYRPDILWNGQFRTVESVDATTYRFIEWAGPFFAATNTHYFTIGEGDVVNTPGTYDGAVQLLNGYGVINCVENPNDMVNACGFAGPQNTVERDDVNGEDIIYRTYGYYTTGSGPREIYEVIKKVVN